MEKCSWENGRFMASIMNESEIMCDEVLESCDKETKTIPTNFNEKKAICKMQNFYILLAFLSTKIALLIAFSIYCYLINIKQYKNIYYHFTPQITN